MIPPGNSIVEPFTMPHTDAESLEVAIQRFDRYLRMMVAYRANETGEHDDCGLTIMENPPPHLNQETQGRLLRAFFEVPPETSPRAKPSRRPPSRRKRRERYVQFAFMKESFYIDVPNNTLSSPEARRLMRCRTGFFFVREHRPPWVGLKEWKSLARDLDPVQKLYRNVDTRLAAEDTAFILHSLWKLPIDHPLYYRSLCFNARRRWEREDVLK